VNVRLSRLQVTDWLLGVSAVALIVVLFAAPWYEVKPQFRDSLLAVGERVSASGWQTFTWVGPLCLIVGLAGIAYAWLQATRRSPALPVVVVTLLTPPALLLVLALLVRVFIAVPTLSLSSGANALQPASGAYVGFGLSLLIAVCAWLSLRREGVAREDAPSVIETVALEPRVPDDRA